MNDHVVDDLGAYLLGHLSGEEDRAVRLHLESCPPCRDELARIQGGAELLDSARFAEEPPEDLEGRILRAVGRDPNRGRRLRRRAVVVTAVVALAGAAFVLGVVVGRVERSSPTPDQTVALMGAEGTTGTARLWVLPTGARRIELMVSGLPRLPEGVAWAVWLDNKRGMRRSAGTFLTAPDGSAGVTLTVGGSTGDYTSIVVARTDAPYDAAPALVGDVQP